MGPGPLRSAPGSPILIAPPLLPCPGPGAELPAATAPVRSGAASCPPPRGPALGPRLLLRVTILTLAAFMPDFCGLHIPAAPAAPSCDLIRAPPFCLWAAQNYDSQQALRR